VHPWPEEVLVPWAAMTLGREVKWAEDRREHFISSAHERAQVQHVRVGFDDEGRVLGLDVSILHDHGAYTPYGIIVPIVTSTQLLGPYRVGAYRVEFTAVYTNTVQVTPYRGAGRPQGVFCMERTMDKIARYLGKDRTTVREANFIRPEEFPYDQGMIFQDGRPLIYDSGDYPEMLRMIKELIGWDSFERRPGRGIGIGCYVEGTGVGPYEGGHVQITSDGRVHVSTGLTSQGQGHETAFAQIAAAELGVPIERVSVVTGDTRTAQGADGDDDRGVGGGHEHEGGRAQGEQAEAERPAVADPGDQGGCGQFDGDGGHQQGGVRGAGRGGARRPLGVLGDDGEREEEPDRRGHHGGHPHQQGTGDDRRAGGGDVHDRSSATVT
ncbi:molybdopterin cofactor-binding domain-containing protein, partial [Nonomuraea fuscirosea]